MTAVDSTMVGPGDNALSGEIERASRRFIERNPGGLAAYQRATGSLPGGNTRSVLFYEPFPLAMDRGEGCRLWDTDGHEYIDFLGEFTAGIYGHSDPVIAAAIGKAVSGGINLGSHNLLEAELAELICKRFGSIELVRFTNSGTEANLLALALAKSFTRKAKVMVFAGGYHGSVLTFSDVSGPVNVPHDYVIAPYNDVEETANLIRNNRDTLAAVIVEPMMGGAGCLAGDPDFLEMLRHETEAAGSLLIFDEVMTSRLSAGGRQALLGIKPDLTTLGKYIGGGMSFGAFGGRSDIMRLFDPREPDALPHAGTFNNNVVSMAAGIAGLAERYTPEAAASLNQRGERLRDELNKAFAASGAALCCSGLGSLMNIHPVAALPQKPGDLAEADQKARELLFLDLLEDGFYMARRGLIALSLPLGDAEVDAFVSAVKARLPRWSALFGDGPGAGHPTVSRTSQNPNRI